MKNEVVTRDSAKTCVIAGIKILINMHQQPLNFMNNLSIIRKSAISFKFQIPLILRVNASVVFYKS